MRADEPIRFCEDIVPMINKSKTADYINQLRYERLMAKAEIYRHWVGLYVDLQTECNYKKYKEKCERIALALEARAKRIKEGM